MRALLLFFALLMPMSLALADAVVSVGVGKGVLEAPGTPFERTVSAGYQFAWGDFFVRPEAGYFFDVSGNGKSSFWVAPIAGLSARSALGPELHVGLGPGYLENPDSLLGGHFQFSLEGGIGMMAVDGKVYLGMAWKHLSSAGIEMPNQGRDFLVIQVRLVML